MSMDRTLPRAKVSRNLFMTIVLIFSALRLLGDIILFEMMLISNDSFVIWKGITSGIVILSLFIYFFKETIENKKSTTDDNYFRDVLILLLHVVVMLIACYYPAQYDIYTGNPDTLIQLVVGEIIALYGFYVTFYALRFTYKWLWIRRHKNTKILLSFVYYFFVILVGIEVIGTYFNIQDLSIIDNVKLLLNLSMAGFVFFVTSKNSWISMFPKTKKFQLLGLTLLIFGFSFSISNYADMDTENLYPMLNFYLTGSSTIVSASFFLLGVHFLRLFFSTIGALPTSELMDRKNQEITSLTYLNSLISKSIDFDKLINTVNELAVNSANGVASWVELYNTDERIVFKSAINIREDQILLLHEYPQLQVYFSEFEQTTYIGSIDENRYLSSLKWNDILLAKSLIIIPLIFSEERIGTIIILFDEEYVLEKQDISVLSAFSDNVSIALENAKLLNDSIEKEKLQRELKLARDMEEKLLPQVLPEIPAYSMSALSMPAQEVGGDYYDVVRLANGKFCILIGDVSGKGMNAAFYMAQLKGVVLSVAKRSNTASEILKNINNVLYGQIDKQMFITMNAVVIENDDGDISLARAGHMPLYVLHSGELNEYLPKGIGIGLSGSAMFDANIEEISIKLEKDTYCLLFTDGLNELQNEELEEFGYEKLKLILKKSVLKNSNIVETLRKEISQFTGNIDPFDDITLFTFKYHGKNENKKLENS
jgi:sigma-B regulation protein RsbU (phosphoserine phosphatase)